LTKIVSLFERLSKFQRNVGLKWLAAAYNTTTGYGILDANMTHLRWVYYSTVGNIIDSVVYAAKELATK
jgi:hypothetical protein